MSTIFQKSSYSGKLFLAAFCLALAGMANSAQAYKGEELAKDAKLSLPDARAIALKARPGTVTDEDLEKENGGSGLRYSFDIRENGKIYEVGVDAKTGKVLENGVESKAGALEDKIESKVKSH